MSKRQLNCGVCGTPKVERRQRLVCPECARRHTREAASRQGPKPITDAMRATKKKYRAKVRASGLTNQKAYSLHKKYGLSEDEYIALIGKQAGNCAICQEPLTNEMLVDHNHATGAVRGLLCRSCNFAIGLFRDNPVLLRAAADYLNANDE